MVKKGLILILCLSLMLGLGACASGGSAGEADGKVKVSVSFDALKEFTEAVGGDRVEISTIIPDGTEPHDFEPKAQDLIGLNEAQVFVYNGLGMEAWAEDAISAAENSGLISVDASAGITPITDTGGAEAKTSGQYDPHIWLSLKCAETEATNIKDALVKADPGNKSYYESNCASCISQLEDLYNEYSGKFNTVENKSFVTDHAAFAYLCRDFGLSQNSVEDVFAEGEPGAQQLGELIEYCRSNNVTTVFAEEMASPEVSQTLASEVGARVETIYTIESAEDGKTYLERMKDNLSEIYASLTEKNQSAVSSPRQD
jgi:zinc transport system substrate-binding protein